VRIFVVVILLLSLLGISEAYMGEAKAGGIAFSFGYESFPGELYYELLSIKYKKGLRVDSKTNPGQENMSFSVLSLRAGKMARIGFGHLFAGIEVGMSLPVSGYEKSWNLPTLTPDIKGVISFPGFC